ncbi:putative protein without homology [Lactobacillus crispatus ST1]|uniref:Uncharacterized protein n=1 Tax=Lactobacillus crispatus (strain ST1) TaxID=748671 RepID=D5GY11_LACCS|nr:putative protein without homology [Lactobacillus crispatus ST1]
MENTLYQPNLTFEHWDHLHIRGEYRMLSQKPRRTVGSPPHTWRIQMLLDQQHPKHRITSTYVENTKALQ